MAERAAPWTADLGDGRYRNPIIHADYSDPDAIRVGDDYFLVSSSFASAPGLPLLHSRDLVNWRIVNHVIESLAWPGYGKPMHGKGVWAPSLRYRAGRFYVYFASPDEGVFMASADDPFGAWTAPVCVKRAIGWIDPCPFWDDDGRAYLVNAFAASRVGFNAVLRISRMAEDGASLAGEGRFVFDGQDRHPVMEGPKLYKRDGYYYIFAPAGGVGHGWQTVLRSSSVWGPYEDRIVLHRGSTAINGPHQGAWVETPEGESWFLHFQDKGPYGRVVHLQPMAWDFDWPRIGVDVDNDRIGEPVEVWRKPAVAAPAAPAASAAGAPPDDAVSANDGSDDFRGRRLGRQWQWQADPGELWFEPRPEAGRLRLFAVPPPAGSQDAAGDPDFLDLPNVLSQKFPAPAFRVEVAFELSGGAGVSAGLVVLGDDYYGVLLRRAPSGYELVVVEGGARVDGRPGGDGARRRHSETAALAWPEGRIALELTVGEGALGRFAYRAVGAAGPAESVGPVIAIGREFVARPGRWVGAKFGICCLAPAAAAAPSAPASPGAEPAAAVAPASPAAAGTGDAWADFSACAVSAP
jgi:hypothetical protein